MQFAGNPPSFIVLRLHQARHVIRNPLLLCCFFLALDVETSAYISFKRSIRRIAWHSSIHYPVVLSRMMPHPVLHLKGTTIIEVADVNLKAAIVVFSMHVFQPAIAYSCSRVRPTKSNHPLLK